MLRLSTTGEKWLSGLRDIHVLVTEVHVKNSACFMVYTVLEIESEAVHTVCSLERITSVMVK